MWPGRSPGWHFVLSEARGWRGTDLGERQPWVLVVASEWLARGWLGSLSPALVLCSKREVGPPVPQGCPGSTWHRRVLGENGAVE